jgi:hypothetical protein
MSTGPASPPLRLWVEPGAPDVSARIALGGDVAVPWLAPARVSAALSGATAELLLHGTDLSAGLTLLRLRGALAEARVRDARAVTRAVSSKVPLLAPLVLGAGPLVLSGSAEVTPEVTILRLLHARLGGAKLHGAARTGRDGWRGAAGGQLAVPFGLRLRGGAVSAVPLAPAGWLERELRVVDLTAE